MKLVDDRTGIEVIAREECLELLAGDVVGRIGFVVAGQAEVLPVNYVLDGDAVVFRTAAGSKLDGATRARSCSRSTASTARPARDGASSCTGWRKR